ncbi:MAG: sterol desaturase family protein [Acidobacteriaceae bacterium]|nr:sterol desaturase family protein [Acidobacteriaceae bacterium]
MISNPIPNSLRALVLGAWAGTLLLLERKRGLRHLRESKFVRDTRNLTVAAGAGVVMQLLEMPVALGLSRAAQRRRWGIAQRLPLPPLLRAFGAILALDYTLYWWHFLTHRVPLLWRFHRVHHIDREMDATTALRFHFGEIAISVIFRAGQMIVVGPTPAIVAVWQVLLFLSILFHHSNVRVPLDWERSIARLIMTPRLHGIHHSIEPAEVNSNWSSGLTVWDWLHRTLRTEVPQEHLVHGVAGMRSDADVQIGRLMTVPLTEPSNVPEYDGKPVRQSFDKLT